MEGNSIPRSRSLFLPFVTDSDPNYFDGSRSGFKVFLKSGTKPCLFLKYAKRFF